MKRSYLSIGFLLIFISQLLEAILKFIFSVIMEIQISSVQTIIVIVGTLMMIVGLLIAKKEFHGLKRAIPILTVQIVANVCLLILKIYGGMYEDGAISAMELIFDTVSTLAVVSVIKDVYVDRGMSTKFVRVLSIIIIIDTF